MLSSQIKNPLVRTFFIPSHWTSKLYIKEVLCITFALSFADFSSLRCKGINNGCCTKSKPCNVGDGDCDNDNQCAGSLVSGTDNCPWGGGDDCCMDPVNKLPGK